MSGLLDKIQKDLVVAQKSKDALLVSTLRYLSSAVKNKEIELRPSGKALGDLDVLDVLSKQIKQRKESMEEFKRGGRTDLFEKEQKELAILERYLPKQLSDEELSSLISDTIKELSASSISDMGKVMGALTPKVKGKADMSLVSSLVKKRLEVK